MNEEPRELEFYELHAFIGWEAAAEGETIPYETSFLNKRPLSKAEREYAKELAADLGL